MKSDKVKAIVARKRPIKTVSTPQKTVHAFKETTNVSSSKEAAKFKNASPTKPVNALLKPAEAKTIDSDKEQPKATNIDSLLSLAKVSRPEDEATISLNIATNFELPAGGRLPGEKKKKLSRFERNERVMQKRIEFAQHKTDARKMSQNVPKIKADEPQQSNSTNHSRFGRAKKTESLFKDVPEIPNVGQRFVKPLNEIVFTGLPMESIGLHPHLVKTLADLLGITELTNVQQRAVPVALEHRDILVRSQTGSGKTLAYALPLVQQLQAMRPKITRADGILSLVIVPTRELALQTLEVFTKLLKPFTWIVPTHITGGEKRKSEKARFRKGVNILIGTPGRICDHLLHTESFKLDDVKYLVLDEADRLYECGYEKDVQMIINDLNKDRNPFKKGDDAVKEKAVNSQLQTILLSATLPQSVHQLAGLALKDPLFIDTCDKKNVELPKTITVIGKTQFTDDAEDDATAASAENIVIPENITQKYIFVPPKLRMVTLTGLIANETSKKSAKVLIFMATENLVDYHYDVLVETLTRKVVDSDDDDGGNDSDADMIKDSDSELDDEDGLLDDIKMKKKKQRKTTFKPLLADVKFFK